MTTAPTDWDFESYCVHDDCHQPATHSHLTSIVDDTPVYEMVCCTHALKESTR